jgi:hypothetical protein
MRSFSSALTLLFCAIKMLPPELTVFFHFTGFSKGSISKPRGKRPLIEIVMKLEYIENLRIKKVFDPAALMRMTESSYTWWNNTDADQQAILKVIESIRQ